MSFNRTDVMTLASAAAIVILAVTGAVAGDVAVAFLVGSVLKSPVVR